MQASFTIDGRMPGLNEYTRANRNRRWPEGKQMKEDETTRAAWCARGLPKFRKPVWVTFHWFEPDRGQKRDIDNVAFAKKFILDVAEHLRRWQDPQRARDGTRRVGRGDADAHLPDV